MLNVCYDPIRRINSADPIRLVILLAQGHQTRSQTPKIFSQYHALAPATPNFGTALS
jgi:hypothetical protein